MRRLYPISAGGPGAASAALLDLPRPLARGRGIAALFVPDLALSVAVIAVTYLLMLFGGASGLFRDADAGWHIRSGEQMIENRALPAVDSFSFSKAGQPWIAWEWAADVLVGAVHRAAGLSGVASLYAFAIGACVWMWFRLNWAAGGNFVLACLFAAPMLSTTNLHWLARPHIFGWLFVIGSVWFCESGFCESGRQAARAELVGVAVVSAVWANVHGSFILGPAIALIYAVGSWLGSVIWNDESRHRKYLFVAAASLIGSLANPHGWNLHRHVLAYLSDSALLDRIGEFQSFNFHAEGAGQIILALLIGAAGGFAALSSRRPERFLLAMLFTAAALRSARMLPVAALVLLPLANGSLSELLRRTQVAPRLRIALDGILDYGSRLRALDRNLSGVALIPALALALFGIVRATHPTFPPDQFPVAAAERVSSLPPAARIFSSDKFGGYLIYRFAGERRVFFDGRSDFYGADFLKTYSRLVQARPGWRDEFARQRFTYALLPPDYSLVAALEADGWKPEYRDATAVLLKGSHS